MKKRFGAAIAAAALMLAMIFMLTACGSALGGIQKRFEKDGWTFEKASSVTVGDYGTIVLYYTYKTLLKGEVAVIIEGKAGSDFAKMAEELQSNEEVRADIKLVLKSMQDSPVVNQNCAIVTLSSSALKLFRNE